MTGSGPLPYLEVCGVEVANAARTLDYLRHGLANTLQGHWELGNGDVCSVLRRLGGGSSDSVFTSPTSDPAPWYDSSEPGSATFLGFVLLDIQGYDSTIYRQITNKTAGLGGATFSGQYRLPRTWKFRAAMISADDVGAEFGLRWLTDVLETSSCVGCTTCGLKVRLACPPSNASNDSLGEWSSYQVALTAGPYEVDPWGPSKTASMADSLAGCRDYAVVEFTMTAANPFLYKRATTCFTHDFSVSAGCSNICTFLFGDSAGAVCCTVAPPKRGAIGAIFTCTSTLGCGGLTFEAYHTCPGGSSGVLPERSLTITGVPANGTVVVDCAQHKITVTSPDPVTGVMTTRDGQYLIDISEINSFDWIEVMDCDDITCLCAKQGPCAYGDVHVVMQTQAREG